MTFTNIRRTLTNAFDLFMGAFENPFKQAAADALFGEPKVKREKLNLNRTDDLTTRGKKFVAAAAKIDADLDAKREALYTTQADKDAEWLHQRFGYTPAPIHSEPEPDDQGVVFLDDEVLMTNEELMATVNSWFADKAEELLDHEPKQDPDRLFDLEVVDENEEPEQPKRTAADLFEKYGYKEMPLKGNEDVTVEAPTPHDITGYPEASQAREAVRWELECALDDYLKGYAEILGFADHHPLCRCGKCNHNRTVRHDVMKKLNKIFRNANDEFAQFEAKVLQRHADVKARKKAEINFEYARLQAELDDKQEELDDATTRFLEHADELGVAYDALLEKYLDATAEVERLTDELDDAQNLQAEFEAGALNVNVDYLKMLHTTIEDLVDEVNASREGFA